MSFQFALYSQTYVSRSLLFCVVRIEEGRVMRAIVDTILQLFASREVLVPLFFGKKKENNKNTNIRPSPAGETIWLFLLNPPFSSCALLDNWTLGQSVIIIDNSIFLCDAYNKLQSEHHDITDNLLQYFLVGVTSQIDHVFSCIKMS